jgi:hypothetical protein
MDLMMPKKTGRNKTTLKIIPQIYLSFKEAMRILRKMKYNVH